MKKLVKRSYMDSRNSVDLFDADRKNSIGDMYCVSPAILLHQIDKEWKRYIDSQKRKR